MKKALFFFYSDHGGPFPRHKRSLYETGIKVPLVIKFPYSKYGGLRIITLSVLLITHLQFCL